MSLISDLKIAMIHPDYQCKVPETLSIPLGLAWISAYLEEFGFRHECYDLALSPQDKKKLTSREYDVICCQLHSIETLEDSLTLLEEIKEMHPTTKIVVGGIVATFLWDELLDRNFVDFVITGEGEKTALELLKNIKESDFSLLKEIRGIAFRHKNRKSFTGHRDFIKNLDDIPLPNRNAFNWREYPQWSIITSRGCPYECSFCTVPRFWRCTVRFRSPENIYYELCKLEQEYGMKKFFILDDTFSSVRRRVRKLMNMIIEGKHDFEWACLTRADCLDRELLNMFKKAGCTEISFGVESANQKTLDFLKKNLKVSQIEKTVSMSKKIGFRVRCSFIFGLPNEKEEDVVRTINFILRMEPHEVQIYPLFPYPGTPIFQNPEKYGTVISSPDFRTWRKNALNPIAETEYLSRENIIDLVNFCIEQLKKRGYIWIPGDNKPKKYPIEKCVMTEFSPIQALLTSER